MLLTSTLKELRIWFAIFLLAQIFCKMFAEIRINLKLNLSVITFLFFITLTFFVWFMNFTLVRKLDDNK